jgi:AcrR family transcriptional regulator
MFTVSTFDLGQADKTGTSYHHGNLREALVAKGLELLGTGQSAEFSLRELSRLLGVSANALYRHFASKEDLLSAMAAEGYRRLATAQAVAMQTRSSASDNFVESGRAYVNFARQHPALFRLMFSRFSVTNRNQEMQDASQLAFQGLRYGLAAALERDVDDPELATAAIHAWSLVHGMSQLIIDGQFDQHSKDVDAMVDDVLTQAAAYSKKMR